MKGVFQWSGKESFTKYDMVKAMAKAFCLSDSHIKPDTTPSVGAPRPYDAQMNSSRLQKLGIDFHTKFEEGIKESLQVWVSELSKAVTS